MQASTVPWERTSQGEQRQFQVPQACFGLLAGRFESDAELR
jgi:hypothetical protein